MAFLYSLLNHCVYSHEGWISHSHGKNTEQPFNCIQRMRALMCVWTSCWTLPFMAAEEPGATVARVQRLGKVQCFITGGKVIFYQSISNDHKPRRASMLYYRHIQTNLRTKVKKKIDVWFFYLLYWHNLIAMTMGKYKLYIIKIYKIW